MGEGKELGLGVETKIQNTVETGDTEEISNKVNNSDRV